MLMFGSCRIIANRVSAQKSKEKKRNYQKELKKRVELLKMKADNVTAERLMAMVKIYILESL